jgi:Ca-activated chloride channel family protein
MRRLAALLALCPFPAMACETALLLAIDVSGSIDAGEYQLQTEGLTLALMDPAVQEALLQGQVALAVVQWSGFDQQSLMVDWTRMKGASDIQALAENLRNLPRAFDGSQTAVGQAIDFSLPQFDTVSDCARRVIDISGDGPENSGNTVGRARQQAMKAKVTINAIAIEDAGEQVAITNFYLKWVITPAGFVITARGLEDYPRAMREKLLRELEKPAS